jgi:hypothetical protein
MGRTRTNVLWDSSQVIPLCSTVFEVGRLLTRNKRAEALLFRHRQCQADLRSPAKPAHTRVQRMGNCAEHVRSGRIQQWPLPPD